MIAPFAELVAATHYSFLRGASSPSDMVARAIQLGMTGIGIADRNTVAGVVRAHIALREAQGRLAELGEQPIDFRLILGARLVFVDGTPDIIAYPETRHGWGRLTRLLTTGNLRAVKGGCILRFEDLIAHLEDLSLIVLPKSSGEPQEAHRKPVSYDGDGSGHSILRLINTRANGLDDVLRRLASRAADRIWLGVSMMRQGIDARYLAQLRKIAAEAKVPLLATNDALYAEPEQRPLHDILTCTRLGTTIHKVGRQLEANAERHLKAPEEMARLFRNCPESIAGTQRLLARIHFTLDDLRYEYPHEPVPPGWKPLAYLHHLVKTAAQERYGEKLPPKVRKLLAEEFRLIRKRKYAYYFLTVYDLVRFARTCEPPILCQGRGSAANSIVCFLLGVTSVDPLQHDLLFSRFVSEDRNEPPDIDVDFEHERREEVIQYVYERYGRHRAGIAATVIHYRQRSAIREVGKALGLTEDITARLSGTVWGGWGDDMPESRLREAGFDAANPEMDRLKCLVDQLLKFPRHLSQHVGGFILTEDRLDETVPIHNAAMDDRSFIEWDKDDIDALGLMKVDVLALGMLTCIRKSFDLMRRHGLGEKTLELDLNADDPAVYEMLGKGDSIGVFQVESRAQINMLPRLRPADLYDLTIQVAIVRPGPIEGDMVHPYLRRRNHEENVLFPSPSPEHGPPDELHGVLGKTLGVPLFQEQAMRLAIVAARFSNSEANQLRRAMATFRNLGTIDKFRDKMIEGMVKRGYEREFAERCFKQIEGFGSYGFPESHALSFARLVYVSAWIKCHQPAVFTCALLNSQPMGFYASAQLVRDAREHGVEVRPADVNASDWDCTLEGEPLALRLGLRQIDGLREDWAVAIRTARKEMAYASIEDMARRARLPSRALRLLADADALGALAASRREALWEVRRTPSDELPLFAAARTQELGPEADAALPLMPLAEEVVADYQTTRLSLKGHPMQFLRDHFTAQGALSCAKIDEVAGGRRVRAAGVVLIRQRPGKGNAIFITLEDETGITNVLLWAHDLERQRRAVMASRLMMVDGVVQRSGEGVVHLMASRIVDATAALDRLSETHSAKPELCRSDAILHPDYERAPGGHPRNVRVLPRSRDFH
ncbi:MAG: error-prone DNA polymerase [Sphingomonas sp.]